MSLASARYVRGPTVQDRTATPEGWRGSGARAAVGAGKARKTRAKRRSRSSWPAAAEPATTTQPASRDATACPNGSSMLFTAAKVAHLGLLPQGQPERDSRVIDMLEAQDEAGFGGCTNMGECTTVCPKGIPLTLIGRLNNDYRKAFGK